MTGRGRIGRSSVSTKLGAMDPRTRRTAQIETTDLDVGDELRYDNDGRIRPRESVQKVDPVGAIAAVQALQAPAFTAAGLTATADKLNELILAQGKANAALQAKVDELLAVLRTQRFPRP